MAKTLRITFDDLKLLENAESFGAIPATVRDFFRSENLHSSPGAAVIKDPKFSKWYILETGPGFLEIYKMELLEVYDRGVKLLISRNTPTYSDNLDDYPIYRVGIPFRRNEKVYISGHERKQLLRQIQDSQNDQERIKYQQQLEKWDYFFKAAPEEIGPIHRFLISEFEEWRGKYTEILRQQSLKLVLLIIGAILVYTQVWSIVAIPLIAYAFYQFRKIFQGPVKSLRKINSLRKAEKKLFDEKEYLENQLHQTRVSGDQVTKWLEEEISKLDKKKIFEFGLPEDEVIRKEITNDLSDLATNTQQVIGLKIQQWGFNQPLETNGKKTLERQYRHHLQAYRHNQGAPLLGVYFIHFIYLTPETICISGFFFDFILSKAFGTTTKQYYYRDIVSIGTMVTELRTLSDQEEMETKLILLNFVNNEQITIALTDSVAIENLRAQIELQNTLENKNNGFLAGPADRENLDLDQLFDLPDDRLPGTRVNFMVNNIRNFWSGKKKDLLLSSENKKLE